jgi:hypothetical protein
MRPSISWGIDEDDDPDDDDDCYEDDRHLFYSI